MLDRIASAIQRLVAFAERRFAIVVTIAVVLAYLLRPMPDTFVHKNGGDCVRTLTWTGKLMAAGLSAYPSLIEEYNQRWVGFSTPLRYAWMTSIVAVGHVWGKPTDAYHPMLFLSRLGGALLLVPLAFWLRRITSMRVTLLALGLCAMSPLLRGMSRVPLPDSFHMLFVAGACAIPGVLRDATGRRRAWWLCLLALDVVWLLGTRETGVLVMAVVLFLPTLESGWNPRADLPLFGALAAGGLLSLGLWMLCAGGAGAFFHHLAIYLKGAASTGNMAYVSGAYYRYFVDFAIVDPWIVAIALMAIIPLWTSTHRPVVRIVGTSTLAMLSLFSLLTKSLRYVLMVDVGMRVLVAAGLVLLASDPKRRRQAVLAFLVVLGHDIGLYLALYHRQQSYDPTTYSIARTLGFIPW